MFPEMILLKKNSLTETHEEYRDQRFLIAGFNRKLETSDPIKKNPVSKKAGFFIGSALSKSLKLAIFQHKKWA